jgi:hypothetical protein
VRFAGLRGPARAGGLLETGATAVRFTTGMSTAIPRQANLAVEVASMDGVPAGPWLRLWTAGVQFVMDRQSTTGACSLQSETRAFAPSDATIGGGANATLSGPLTSTGDDPFLHDVQRVSAQRPEHEIPPGVDPLVHDRHIVAIRADELTPHPSPAARRSTLQPAPFVGVATVGLRWVSRKQRHAGAAVPCVL